MYYNINKHIKKKGEKEIEEWARKSTVLINMWFQVFSKSSVIGRQTSRIQGA